MLLATIKQNTNCQLGKPMNMAGDGGSRLRSRANWPCSNRSTRNFLRVFRPFYQRLVLSYRWAEIDLQSYRLLANPPGPDLNGLIGEITRDPTLWRYLLPAGYVQFGKGPGADYDPVSFDIRSRKKNGDCRIVKIDHEEILCNERVKVVADLAPTFEQLVVQTIDRASRV